MNFYNKEKSPDYLKGIFETAGEGILVVDANGCILRNNPAFNKLLEYEEGELKGKIFTEIVHKNASVQRRTSLTKIHYFRRSRELPIELELTNKEGIAVPVRLRSVLIQNNKEEALEAIGIVEDLREDKGERIFEQKVWETQETLHNVLDNSGDAIMVADANGRIIIANEALLQMIGYQEDEILGRHLTELSPYEGDFTTTTGEEVSITDEYINYQVEKANELFEKGSVTNYELYFIHKDGMLIPVEATISVLKDKKEGRRGSISICRDITVRKKAEEALKTSEDKYHNLIEHANDAIISSNKEGIITSFNKKAEEMFGYAREKMIGKSLALLSPPSYRVKQKKLLEKFEKTNELYIIGKILEGKGLRKDGQEFPFEGSVYSLEIKGEFILTTIIRDISERKQAEGKIIEYQNQLRCLASQLTLTEEHERRKIATDLHDRIGQSLAISKIKLGALRESASSLGLDGDIEEIRDYIEQTIQDTRSLIFDLCPPFLYELGFEKALEWLAEEVQKQHGVTTLFENDGKPKPLDDDVRVLLFRTVNELLINVVKHAQAQKTKVSVRRDRDNIKINVEDDGIGFDVSKTQHHVDKAGGFGLFRIRERLNYLGGQIKIESEPNRGTRVSLVVPVKCNGKNTKEQVQ
jgi:PAS domain S-box-containing protein